LPVAIMMLGTLVIVVQAYVFTVLSAVYIALATEHEEHGDAHHGPGHGAGHDHDHADHEEAAAEA
ncbi:MAG: hypothetical protein ABI461_18820, partial [Polyangiaceae bacterium]